MSGIYLHIPFCKSRCKYCDFFSTCSLYLRDRYIDALAQEMRLRPADDVFQTIYFGGGTPSQLQIKHIDTILNQLRYNYHISPTAEITFEANPSDLTDTYLRQLHQLGINRLSIGVQSFNDHHLQLIGRRHDSERAKRVIKEAKQAGFDNISIDLIYGIPTQTIDDWQEQLDIAISLEPQHISTYCMTYEEGTVLTHMVQTGEVKETDDDTLNEMYDMLVKRLQEHGFKRYEVSNFAREGFYSRHNSAYWHHIPYLGLGAGAHSYKNRTRQANISDIRKYIDGVAARNLNIERETLTDQELYEEIVMLQLRTSQGIDLSNLEIEQRENCLAKARQSMLDGYLQLTNNHIRLTDSGYKILNRIILELMD